MRALFIAIGALAVLSLTGCGSGAAAGRYDVTIRLAESLKDPTDGSVPSLEVDLVGVSESDAPRWSGYSMTQYFGGEDALRADALRTTFVFTTENPDPKTLDRQDPRWDQWLERGAQELFVLVNLPGGFVDRPGDEDPRRLILPLAKNRWQGRELVVEIHRSGLSPLTKMNPDPEG